MLSNQEIRRTERPEGVVSRARSDRSTVTASRPVGSFFAQIAELEAASVDAFEILAEELVVHGAPADLVRRAHRAAFDERRHARLTGDLAERYGSAAVVPVVKRRAPRDLEAMAIDNATEGCVRETFGALLAMFQAERAEDPDVRDVMRPIADDETRHAALSWAVATWLSTKLDAEALRRVAEARAEAVLALASDLFDPHIDVIRSAGMPTVTEASKLVEALRVEMWGAA
jgi:hypothetical protein